MAARFNPPPGWPPAPEGWTPPPGWSPDPSWPAPPAGWQLWIDDAAPSGDPGVGMPPAPGGPDVGRFAGPGSDAPTQVVAGQGEMAPGDPSKTAVFPAAAGVPGAPSGPVPGQAPGFGQAPGGPAFHPQQQWQQPGGQGGGSSPKGWLVPVIIGVVALLAIFGILFATGVIGGGDEPDGTETSTTEPTEDPTEEPTEDDPTEEPTEDPTEEPTEDDPTDGPTGSASGNGTRNAPLAPGETATYENWTVSIGASNLDAWAEISKALDDFDRDYYEPEAGTAYVMAPTTVTYTGSGSESLFMLDWVYVGGDGKTYSDSCMYSSLPDGLDTYGELYTDAEDTGNVCVKVPSDQADGGVWRVQELSGDEGYFATE